MILLTNKSLYYRWPQVSLRAFNWGFGWRGCEAGKRERQPNSRGTAITEADTAAIGSADNQGEVEANSPVIVSNKALSGTSLWPLAFAGLPKRLASAWSARS